MSIYHGSNLLEVQYNCNRLWHILNDYQRGWSDRSEDSVSKCAGSAISSGPPTVQLLGGAPQANEFLIVTSNANNASYLKILTGRSLVQNGASSNAFCFQLPSALFGSMATCFGTFFIFIFKCFFILFFILVNILSSSSSNN